MHILGDALQLNEGELEIRLLYCGMAAKKIFAKEIKLSV